MNNLDQKAMTYKQKFYSQSENYRLCVAKNYINNFDTLKPSVRKVIEGFYFENKTKVEQYKA